MIKKIFVLSCLIALVSCSDSKNAENNLNDLNSFKVNQDDLSNILKTKGFTNNDGKRQERLKKSYIERNAIASIVVNENILDMSVVSTEIKRNRNEILIKHYFDQYLKDASSLDAIKNYYDTHKDEFTTKQIHLAHVLIKLSPKADVNTKAKVLKKAKTIADELRRGGDFNIAAKQYSDDKATKNKGGDLNWIKQTKNDQILFNNASLLNMGDIPEPILTTQGYHIIKLVEPIKKDLKPLNEVKDKIAYKLKYDAKVGELKRLKTLAKNKI